MDDLVGSFRRALQLNGPALLAEIKAKHAIRDACAGHVYRHGIPRPGRWTCESCGHEADAGDVGAYVQGLRHAARAAELIAAFEAGR